MSHRPGGEDRRRSFSMVQRFLLWLYPLIDRSGILRTAAGRWVFETLYLMYKRFFEARGIGVLRQWVAPDAWIIDVGANIGFFSLYFAHWVRGAGRVVALEPEGVNFSSLRRRMAAHPRGDRVLSFNMAAAERDGTGFLQLNPHHPADHRLASQGISVVLISLDALVAGQGEPQVGLIKIDVQGSEERVLRGAQRLIHRCHPALLVELTWGDPGTSRTLTLLTDWRYLPHRIDGAGGRIVSMTVETCLSVLEECGYMDCLFLFKDQVADRTPKDELRTSPGCRNNGTVLRVDKNCGRQNHSYG
ncbi:MAG: FkbM family methyltransferase [Magnetococcales bacterium]|nr:FkbM family methyltransferase [Magnetococcales bacterium]